MTSSDKQWQVQKHRKLKPNLSNLRMPTAANHVDQVVAWGVIPAGAIGGWTTLRKLATGLNRPAEAVNAVYPTIGHTVIPQATPPGRSSTTPGVETPVILSPPQKGTGLCETVWCMWYIIQVSLYIKSPSLFARPSDFHQLGKGKYPESVSPAV